MKIEDQILKEVLLKGSYVSEENVKKAEDFATSRRSSIVDFLLLEGLLTNDLLGQAVAEYYGVGYADLNSRKPSPEQLSLLSESLARKFRTVLFSIDKKKREMVFATDDPSQKELLAELKKAFPGKKIILNYSLSKDIDAVLVLYRKSLESRFSRIIGGGQRVVPEILNEIFSDAFFYHASDIHFEPWEDNVAIRFRIDGVLREAGELPLNFYENILNKIKVMSGLRIDEHFAAQDGAIHHQATDFSVDFRCSIIPTVNGEKTVLRVLASYDQGLNLSNLGLSLENQEILSQSAKKPFGMILVTGPTGSGKTTTLYSLLKIINNPELNLTTIEDPVEYKIKGINQIQVNLQTNLTFAKGLRSIVRQDPDIILVGEIRDEETAEISVNAALTGHLLFSTFHANDAATAIPRLLDMKIEPFLLASTLELVIAQRLVRKVCEHCRYSFRLSRESFKSRYGDLLHFWDKKDDEITLYQGKGCEICNQTGYFGRTAIFEFIKMTPDLQALILKNPSSQEISKVAKKNGSRTMFEDGVVKVKSGVTTFEELFRVAELES